jgi:hypothetical protein
MAGCAEELDVVMNRKKKLKEFFSIKRVSRNNISFIDPPLGVFGEIFPSVMIFLSPRDCTRQRMISYTNLIFCVN